MNKFACCRWRAMMIGNATQAPFGAMPRFRWFLHAVVLLLTLTGSAWAQTAGAPAMSGLGATENAAGEARDDPAQVGARRWKALRQVAHGCRVETERFCPTLVGEGHARDQALCLKNYKSNLSLGCRTSVTAATAPSP